ncbi:hypothetical protein [Corynebacterium sp. HS2168-gen11]|uniref:hypothetical protein n=1 Tax=Corynebacterium sp. HS2168-gen11 TaxID=2974027 RepID=UPI00216AE1D6|nr:hypothetical protein [Corynebacterium sp. HS2168-gen11]MCS4536305.1 hypothetical protein [Corynebacterium sp. HS2168-gen11]
MPRTNTLRHQGLTKLLVTLQLKLLWRSLRSNTSAMVMAGILLFYGSIGIAFFLFSFSTEFLNGEHQALPGIIAFGILIYLIAAVMYPAGETQITPEALSPYPISVRELAPRLMLLQLLQVRSVLVIISTTATLVLTIVLSISQGLFSWPLLIGAIVIMIASAFLTLGLGEVLVGSLTSTSTASTVKDKRSYLSIGAMLLLFVLYLKVVADPQSSFLSFSKIGAILQWTPLGAPGLSIVGILNGQYGHAAYGTILTLATVCAIVIVFYWNTARHLIAPLAVETTRSTHTSGAKQRKLLLPGLPATPGSAIFSRSLRNILHDSRQNTQLFMLGAMSMVFFYFGFSQSAAFGFSGVFVLVYVTATLAMNDYGYDGPANWIHLTSSVPARVLVPARHFASVVIPYTYACIYLLATVALFEPKVAIMVIGHGIAACLVGGSIGLLLSTYNPFPTATPGTNPFHDRSGASGSALFNALILLFAIWPPLIPGIALGIYAIITGKTVFIAVSIIVSLIIVLAFYAFAMKLAIRRVEGHYPEIFAKVRTFI